MSTFKKQNTWKWKDSYNIICESILPQGHLCIKDKLKKFEELQENNRFEIFIEEQDLNISGNTSELYLIIKQSVINSSPIILENSPYPMLSQEEVKTIAKVMTEILITSENHILANLSTNKSNAIKEFVLLLIAVIIELQKSSGQQAINLRDIKINLNT